MLDSLLKLLTPIIPHTTSESYSYMNNANVKDVYLLDMPEVMDLDRSIEPLFEEFMNLREDVLKALENARNEKVIGKSLNAKLVLYPKGKTLELLDKLGVNLAQVFIVSSIEIKKDGFGTFKGNNVSIDVLKAEGITCDRCWQVVPEVNDEGVCPRCAHVLE